MGLIKRFVARSSEAPVEAKAPELVVPPDAEAPERSVAETAPPSQNASERVVFPTAQSRAALDHLNVLQSLAPVFRAVTIFPGHDAAPDQVAAAVRRLSAASVGLADFIVANGDRLEIDAGWARKALHAFTADMVSSYWISTVIAKGGADALPEVSADLFKPAVLAAMATPGGALREDAQPHSTLQGTAQLALLQGLTPIAVEVERYAAFIGAHVPGFAVPVGGLVDEMGQFLIEQATMNQERIFAADYHQDASENDRRLMLQALLKHAADVVLSSWEYYKGEVYAGISEASSIEAARVVLTQTGFTQGFPLQALKVRAAESLRRLVGSASYAVGLLMQSQTDDPRA